MYPSSNDPRKINQINSLSIDLNLNNDLKNEIIDLTQQNISVEYPMFNKDIAELIELIQALHYLDIKHRRNESI